MPTFGRKSTERLTQAHPDLQHLFSEIIKTIDCSVLCGYRGKEEQEAAYRDGNSKLHFPDSKHNHLPSLAVDVAPYPINWQNIERFKSFGEFVKKTAEELGIKIRWGGDFKTWKDYPHYEIISVGD